MAAPRFEFAPPELTAKAARSPVELTVRVEPVLPGGAALAVEAVTAGRAAPLAASAGGFRGPVRLLPSEDERVVDLTARFPDGTAVTGKASDLRVKVGPGERRLSGLKEVIFRPVPKVVGDGGAALEGPVAGFERFTFRVGGQPVTLDLTASEAVTLVPEFDPPAAEVTFVARREGAEVGRFRAEIPLGGPVPKPPPAPPAAAAKPEPPAKAADLGEAMYTRQLPAPFAEVVPGGRGRYLVLHLPSVKKLAVFDVPEGRVAGYIPAESPGVKFAAGAAHAVVLLPGERKLERWSLPECRREESADLGRADPATAVALGGGSDGPVLVAVTPGAGQLPFRFHDLMTLAPLTVRLEVPEYAALTQIPNASFRASADGRTFVGTNGIEVVSAVLSDGTAAYARCVAGGVYALPSPNGRVIYTGRGKWSSALKALDRGDSLPREDLTLPALQGDYFLRVRREGSRFRQDAHSLVEVWAGELPKPIATFGPYPDLPVAPYL